jgi:hypothetical protein
VQDRFEERDLGTSSPRGKKEAYPQDPPFLLEDRVDADTEVTSSPL